MENENIEVLIKKKKKKILVWISFCVILAICVFIFFSNYVSKDEIKIIKTNVVSLYPNSWIRNDGYQSLEMTGVLIENMSNCPVDLEIKGVFYDKDNNWLGEQIYEQIVAPNTKNILEPWIDIAKNGWAKQIAREEYTLLKCKKSKLRMINVGFFDGDVLDNDDDITVWIDKKKDEVILVNNTKHDIKANIRLREIYYIKDNYIAENNIIYKTDKLIPANEKISVSHSSDLNDEYQKIKEASEKTETFFYGWETEEN